MLENPAECGIQKRFPAGKIDKPYTETFYRIEIPIHCLRIGFFRPTDLRVFPDAAKFALRITAVCQVIIAYDRFHNE
jgi:hypothetical protein